MPVATLNAEGQATIPGEIRRHLRLKPGDRVNFEVDAAGRVVVTAASVHLRDLEGCLPPQPKPLTVEEIDDIIGEEIAKDYLRGIGGARLRGLAE